MSSSLSVSRPAIPGPYRFLFTTLEPLLATGGAIQAFFFPASLLAATMPSVPYAPPLAPLFTQMTGAWLMLALHDLVTLRSAAYGGDVRAWRHTLLASAVSDVFYTAALVQSTGAARFFNPLRWDLMNAVTVVTTVGPFLGKLCFLAGVGLPKTGAAETEDAKKTK
ncbi:hypothetical protein F5X97DRAFT_270470 [Nemania serpens]|nr:hypothetical protein F5X97DRAFT_270470 [Nemania serpens]